MRIFLIQVLSHFTQNSNFVDFLHYNHTFTFIYNYNFFEYISSTWITSAELAKERMLLRTDSTKAKTFNDFIDIRASCWIVEKKAGQFYCDCYNGIKGRFCKHAIGLMYKTCDLTVTEDVRSKPLGQKRRRGRPKKLPHCLVNSPPPMATYQPSPILAALPVPDVPEIDILDLPASPV